MLFDQNRMDAIIQNWKNQVFSNETIPGVPQRHSTCLKPPNGGFWNLASSYLSMNTYYLFYLLPVLNLNSEESNFGGPSCVQVQLIERFDWSNKTNDVHNDVIIL